FNQIQQLQSWSIYDVILMYGLIRGSSAISVLLFNSPWIIPGYIRSGTFDILFVRPPSPLFQIIGNECLEPSNISSLLIAITSIWVAITRNGLPLQIWWFIYIPLIIVSGAILQFSLLLMVACLSVRFISIHSAMYPVGWFIEFGRF